MWIEMLTSKLFLIFIL